MTTPAATAALARALHVHTESLSPRSCTACWFEGMEDDPLMAAHGPFARSLLRTDFTPAERAALAAVLLDPVTLSTALFRADVEDGTRSHLGLAKAILAALSESSDG